MSCSMSSEIGHSNFCMCNNCRKKHKMITMTRRFYMGAASLREGNPPLKLMSEAIQEAKDYLSNHPECEERYIVQVVKVVRRASVPCIVEDVRCE